jgi:hypothetical protein
MKLNLHVKREYFYAIVGGDKTEEYRLVTPYWEKRLVGRMYDSVIVWLGYPKQNDTHKKFEVPWRGYSRKHIIHKHFGPVPVEVFAIRV